MAQNCICFTTDANYLFPTIVSAIQARANSSPELADVAVYCVGEETSETQTFADVCAAENVQFFSIPRKAIDGAQAAFARLFLDSLVPSRYTDLLYVDGDTQIRGSLDPLLSTAVPAGKFLAASDPNAFKYAEIAAAPEDFRKYCQRLGLASVKDYFNSGVLRMNREGWGRVGQQAYEFCKESCKNRLHFFDQDGLNAIAAQTGVRLPLPIKYNFPIFLRNCRLEAEVQPVIYHFMSAPKPWNGNFPPWDEAATFAYADVRRRFPALASYHGRFSPAKHAKYFVQQRAKQLHELLSWGFGQRRLEILSYEKLCSGGR